MEFYDFSKVINECVHCLHYFKVPVINKVKGPKLQNFSHQINKYNLEADYFNFRTKHTLRTFTPKCIKPWVPSGVDLSTPWVIT